MAKPPRLSGIAYLVARGYRVLLKKRPTQLTIYYGNGELAAILRGDSAHRLANQFASDQARHCAYCGRPLKVANGVWWCSICQKDRDAQPELHPPTILDKAIRAEADRASRDAGAHSKTPALSQSQSQTDSPLVRSFLFYLRVYANARGLPADVIEDALIPEYRFDKTRKWRFDLAIPTPKIAIELEGGTFTQGRHVRAQGYAADCEKYNAAAAQGWRVFRYTALMLKYPERHIQLLLDVLERSYEGSTDV